jgi:hypothetical protein
LTHGKEAETVKAFAVGGCGCGNIGGDIGGRYFGAYDNSPTGVSDKSVDVARDGLAPGHSAKDNECDGKRQDSFDAHLKFLRQC